MRIGGGRTGAGFRILRRWVVPQKRLTSGHMEGKRITFGAIFVHRPGVSGVAESGSGRRQTLRRSTIESASRLTTPEVKLDRWDDPPSRPAARGTQARLARVTAVVLNWCGEEDTVACVRSLLGADYPALDILVVDNGSPDGSGARIQARFPEIPYLGIEKNVGYTGGNNLGIQRALESGADYVLILNNDTELESRCVSELVTALEASPGTGGVAPKMLYHAAPDRIWYGGGTISRLRGLGVHRREGEQDRNLPLEEVEDVTFLSGCCLLVPADVLREVGGFAEDFFAYVEDVEFSARLRAAGYRLLYQPKARLLHKVPLPGAEPSPLQIFLRDRNRRRFARRNFTWLERMGFLVFFYPSRIVRLFGYLARGERERARSIWRGMTSD